MPHTSPLARAKRIAVIGTLAGVGYFLGVEVGNALQPDPQPAPVSDYPTDYPPCATEDSAGPCMWDADRQGNDEGRSFIVERDGTVTYLDRV
jgi:hypothetical protein